MRTFGLTVIAVVFCFSQTATAQTVEPGAPITLEPAPVSTESAYYSNGTVANPCVYPPTAVGSSYTVGGTPAGYPAQRVYRPVVPVWSMPSTYYVGRGLLGQVKIYVPGQPIRNALRYLTL